MNEQFEKRIKVLDMGSMESVYVGAERRSERRRSVRNEDFERLLRHFGLDRRARKERRSTESSWLILSEQSEDMLAVH